MADGIVILVKVHQLGFARSKLNNNKYEKTTYVILSFYLNNLVSQLPIFASVLVLVITFIFVDSFQLHIYLIITILFRAISSYSSLTYQVAYHLMMIMMGLAIFFYKKEMELNGTIVCVILLWLICFVESIGVYFFKQKCFFDRQARQMMRICLHTIIFLLHASFISYICYNQHQVIVKNNN